MVVLACSAVAAAVAAVATLATVAAVAAVAAAKGRDKKRGTGGELLRSASNRMAAARQLQARRDECCGEQGRRHLVSQLWWHFSPQDTVVTLPRHFPRH